MFKGIKDIIQGKRPHGVRRSSQWRAVRAAHLEKHPTCEACGGKEQLEVHHVEPFHKAPALELAASNLVTLCESKKRGVNCHLFFGHLGNYKDSNARIWRDLEYWSKRQALHELEKVA